ncbi:MAG: GAF domain-containing sensor histidine kinase, partial [Chloroflexi bacterium]|nr:GAF domain-containing sensor histidine kinase [Chloroflexota bacterium]
GMSGRAVSQRKPIQGFDCLRDRRYSEYRSEALREGYRSMLATPLISKKMVLGTLTVYSATPHCFTRDEIQLLTVLANHSAIAIENARLYAEQQRRLTLTELAMYTSLEKLSHQQKFQVVSYHGNKELAILYRLSQAITSAMGVQDILELALSELSNVLSFSVAAVFLYDENKEHLSLAASRNLMHLLPDKTALTIPRGRGLARRVAEQGKPLLVNDADSDPDFKRVFKGVPMGPAMCVPLKVGDEVLGVFILGSHLQGSYAEDRLSFITTFGNQLAVAIVNANHVRRMENMAILEERARIAQDMHDGLAQRLASLNLQTAVVHDLLLSNEVEDAREELVKIMEGIEESNREIREAIQGLRFRSESLPNIRMWLQAYAEDFSRRTGISAVVEAPEKVIVLSSAVQSALLRIFQEALSNVRKHARARNVRIGLKTSANFITLTVEDNGCGFISTSRPTGESSRFGLSVMKERAQQFGGDARVSSVPGRGTKVVIKVPVIGRRQRN